MTNTFDPISSRYNKLVRREIKQVLAPRLRELEEFDQVLPQEDVHDHVTIDATPVKPHVARVEGCIAAAILAPAIGLLALGLLNLLVPVIDGLGLRGVFFENGLSNLTIVLTLGAWLLSWVVLYEAWRDRTVSRVKLYSVTVGVVAISIALLTPFVYRLLET